MQNRRWIALIIAILLVFMSIGFRFTASLASGMFTDLFEGLEFDDLQYDEEIIQDGDFDKKIAVIPLHGAIMDVDTPSFLDGYHHKRLLRMIDQAFTDPTVDGVILRVDSPGGEVGATAEIHRKIVDYQEEFDKPFYVSMGTMAASGGYYVAAPADKIFAESSTLTGSIGVIMQNINFAGLAEKHGVEVNTIKSGKHKDIMSPTREMTEEEKDIMQSMIDEMYDEFVQVIVDGRQLSEEKVREIGDGRVYTGNQAKEVDLVDEIGNLLDAAENLMIENDLENAKIVQYSTELSFFDSFLMTAQSYIQQPSELSLITKLIHESDQPRAMYIY